MDAVYFWLRRLYTDPTYKEWKPFLRLLVYLKHRDTDPTYKEWKQGFRRRRRESCEPTRILPTRNGNQFYIAAPGGVVYDTDPTYKEWKRNYSTCHRNQHRTRILPTRNGNAVGVSLTNTSAATRILPTRNGNNSLFPSRRPRKNNTDPTYKEWKRTTFGA